jgi:hypothetical protein
MKVPLAVNPNGQPPNFVDPPSLQPAMLAVGITLIVLGGTILALRLYANLKHSRKLYLDDGKTWHLSGWCKQLTGSRL